MRWFRRKRSEPDLAAFRMDLHEAHAGVDPMAVYQAFQRTFESRDGKIVLYEILNWARIYGPLANKYPVDPISLAMAEGQRLIALKIMAAILNPPKERADRQTRSERR